MSVEARARAAATRNMPSPRNKPAKSLVPLDASTARRRTDRSDRPARTRRQCPPVRDVYDPKQQTYRVDFAAAHILRGGGCTRKFDTCFEMHDGRDVARRLYRRALLSPALAKALPTYVRWMHPDEYHAQVFIDGRFDGEFGLSLEMTSGEIQLNGLADFMARYRHDGTWTTTWPLRARSIVKRIPGTVEACDTLLDTDWPHA